VRGIAYDDDINDPVAHVAGSFMTIGADPRQDNPAHNPALRDTAGDE
jgi:hypothetical protein